MNLDDALEFFLAGASAIQVGTAIFSHPGVLHRLVEDLQDWCGREGVRSLREIVGAAHAERVGGRASIGEAEISLGAAAAG